MIDKRLLFVEGDDDLHTIWALCKHYKVEETFAVEVPDNKGKVNRERKRISVAVLAMFLRHVKRI